MKLFRHLAMLALPLAAAVCAAPVSAQSTRICQVSAVSAAQSVQYDPFAPTQLQVNNVSVTFTRTNGAGGQKPSRIDLYLRSTDARANGMMLIPVSVVGSGNAAGLNQNIFYDFPGPYPVIPQPLGNSPLPGVMRWDYTGDNEASDVFTILFQVTVPPNLDLSAGGALQFDVDYGCSGTGGGKPFYEKATAPNAFTLNIEVRSALQAGYAGSALDFGEVGDLTDADVLTTPKVTPTGNYIRVQSSGPYEVTLTSARGYLLTPGGTANLDPLQQIRYRLKFLGQERDSLNTTAINAVCPRARVGLAFEDRLNLQAKLAQGGSDKAPSPNYRDELTVTIAPRAALTTTTTSGADCDTLGGTF
jgi:hypothetical protein